MYFIFFLIDTSVKFLLQLIRVTWNTIRSGLTAYKFGNVKYISK